MIIEVAGLAGVGKSTVWHMLGQRKQDFRTGCLIRKKEFVSSFIKMLPLLISSIPDQIRSKRWFSPKDIKVIVRLNANYSYLKKYSYNKKALFVLDQGPFYMMAWLRTLLLNKLECRRLNQWFNRMLNEMPFIVDTIIWLEAPDETLIERIRKREKKHRVKDKSDKEVIALLHQYRASFNYILNRFNEFGSSKLFCFDTNRESPDHIVRQIIDIITSDKSLSIN